VLDLAADLQVGLVYNISNAQLAFPPSGSAQSGGEFNIGDTPLSLSLSPDVTATGNFTAHLIPSINLGISALDDAASANIFLNLDASATLVLELQGSDDDSNVVDSTAGSSNSSSTSTSTSSNSTSTSNSSSASYSSSSLSSTASSSSSYYSPTASNSSYNSYYKRFSFAPSAKPTSVAQAISAAKRAAYAPTYPSSSSSSQSPPPTYATSNTSSNSTDNVSNSTAATSSSSNSTSSSSSGLQFGGCVEIDVGLAVNAGAEGKFFDIFDDSTSVPLFNKEFVLFQKCFGDASSSSLAAAELAVPPADDSSSADILSCLAGNVGVPASVIQGATIAAKAVKAIEAA